MKLVYINPNPSGAYPPIQEGNFSSVPEGMAVWPEDMSADVFYTHNGFVRLTVTELEDIPTVSGCTPNLEAWEAWQASQGPAPDPLEAAKTAKLAELSAACNAAITAGMAVETSKGREHFALQETDQINLSTAVSAIQSGAAGYPYHADGQLCRIFSAEEIQDIARKATAHKLEHTTYYNHLAAWVRRCETVDELVAITYGAALPQDLEDSMAAILAAAGGESDVV